MTAALTIGQLIAAGIGPTPARRFVDPLARAFAAFDISTPARQAAFIAQCSHESMGFTALEESLYYRDPGRLAQIFSTFDGRASNAMPYVRNGKKLANRVYANRLGNGDEASGDGWNYRGRGLIQLTGRDNYRDAMRGTGRPYGNWPDLLTTPADAALSAAWFWKKNGLNELADASAIDAITRRVNGPAMLAAAARKQGFQEALEALTSHA